MTFDQIIVTLHSVLWMKKKNKKHKFRVKKKTYIGWRFQVGPAEGTDGERDENRRNGRRESLFSVQS